MGVPAASAKGPAVRVYLLTPASTAVLRSPRYARLEPALMPMALGYLGAVLRRDGHYVFLRDQAALTLPNSQVLDEIRRFAPDLVGISALTGAWRNTLALVQELRRRFPRLPLVMGNTHATIFAEGILQRRLADYIVRGEGEITLSALVATLAVGGDLAAVAGLSWRDGERVRHNPDRDPIADLDSLPHPAWDLLDLSAWRYQRIPLVNLRTHPVPLAASRGCPYRCRFCSQDKVVRAFRQRRLPAVMDEIEFMVQHHGFRAFGFNDSYFPWDRDTGLEFATRLRGRPWHQDVRWVTETRVDRVDDGLMAALARSGLHAVFYGFESGNQQVLTAIGKGTTLEQGREAVAVAQRHGVLVIGFFMVGLPGDTPETMEQTVRYAIDLGVDIAKFAVTVPYPGSSLFDQMGRDWLEPADCQAFASWTDWSDGEPGWSWAPRGLHPQQVLDAQRRGMLQFYARPRYLWQVLRKGLFTPAEMLLGARLLLERVRGHES